MKQIRSHSTFGLAPGEVPEKDLGLDLCFWFIAISSPPVPSSGRGPRVEPPLAELTPDMADTLSPLRLLDRIKLC